MSVPRPTRRRLLGGAGGLAALALAGCVAERPTTERQIDPENAYVGISMPTKSLERWNRDGANLEKELQALGYRTTLQYADNRTDQQISQIQNMVTGDVDIVVIASIDGTVLGPVIEQAAAKGITVIAYDRLIEGSEAVDYYVTFDNFRVGQMQGEAIVEALGMESEPGPFHLELFAGSPDDPNAAQFFGGTWDVLEPYFADGRAISPSGKVPASAEEWTSIGILGWDSAKAQSEMQTRLNSFYADGTPLHAVLAPADSLALGIEQAIAARGYVPGQNWPFVTGQDADKANVLNMLADKQGMTVFKDMREQGKRAAIMCQSIIAGEEPEITPDAGYNNGVKDVPTFLLEPQSITKEDIPSVLVDSGFYTADELGL
ncbi:sugar-binding protein [Brachybacterium phenoliresistens]|uniref:ABC transporter substrate-binding protein n=1 Tax=Brachybacterium phenoliresistens TaxID=396014 RepID=Z9JNW2_9MICO|nr:sugar-binding protein [Brachybacterium phenoliresistens]EWS80080.1 ABC transporter substrate-binding protein [Brachybacterium phenoliresistens]